MVHLVIAGHGKQRNGTFDPGATGYIKKGEHKYVVEDLFPAIKRHLPKGHDVVLFSKYKVSNYGNIAALAKEYKASQITEIHFDAAAAESARGGHVIVHKSFAPDKADLALRDAIKKMVGVRYSHKGHEGISGRDNLYNVNATAKAGITYRLIELGFGSNKRDADILTKQVDQYAKELVKAITGKVSDKQTEQASKPQAKPSTSTSKTYKVVKSIAGYVNAADAKSRKNKKTTVKSNTYHVYKESNGMINVSAKKGSPGSWINPADNKKSTGSASKPKTFKVGQKVKIKSSAKKYSRSTASIPTRYKNKSYTIQQVGSNDVLIKELYSWIRKSDVQ